MNKNKKGKPFVFPNSFILVIGYIRTSFRLPYRQTEGVINATENVYYYRLIRVMVISVKESTSLTIDIKKDKIDR